MIVRATERFTQWFEGLADRKARLRIQVRIDRLEAGNPGQRRVLKGGVVELKIDYGSGYRLYYTQRGAMLAILLCGGDKRSQRQDIRDATAMVKQLQEVTMTLKTVRWDSARYLKTDDDVALYLETALDEGGDDPAFVAHALGVVARARNMSQLARDTGLTREGLYKALSADGNPSFATVAKVAGAFGLRMSVRPVQEKRGKGNSGRAVDGVRAEKAARRAKRSVKVKQAKSTAKRDPAKRRKVA